LTKAQDIGAGAPLTITGTEQNKDKGRPYRFTTAVQLLDDF
jgi:hypothetical protein